MQTMMEGVCLIDVTVTPTNPLAAEASTPVPAQPIPSSWKEAFLGIFRGSLLGPIQTWGQG